ncbi:MAG: hypothetical protein ACI84E_002262, partial [Planctomycetota bacterium]
MAKSYKRRADGVVYSTRDLGIYAPSSSLPTPKT